MRILFTGHRDCVTDECNLDRVAEMFPGAVWVHGGAKGFDTQVEQYAKKHGIPTEVHKPDYQRYGRRAPILRDEAMVDSGVDRVIGCYDGRQRSGTRHTLEYARRKRISVLLVEAIHIPKVSGQPEGK